MSRVPAAKKRDEAVPAVSGHAALIRMRDEFMVLAHAYTQMAAYNESAAARNMATQLTRFVLDAPLLEKIEWPARLVAVDSGRIRVFAEVAPQS